MSDGAELVEGDITDEMIQAMDTAKRQGLQKDLRALAADIRPMPKAGMTVRSPGDGPASSGHCCGSRTRPAG
ncbi:hypothetical protein ABTZ93_04140 [Streptomyces sp. NPDC097941]|uniref:hypothetical protein n=1 Tax=Streptomyces sp. NPDC097941 TaxID=3155685 RepID=UPI003333A4EB